MKKIIYPGLFALVLLLTSAVTEKYVYVPDIYAQWLRPVTDVDSLTHFKAEMTAIKSGPDKLAKNNAACNGSDRWTLVAYQYQGWEQHYPSQRNRIDENFICNGHSRSFTTDEILATFKIKDSIRGHKITIPCDYFPVVLGSASVFDAIWTAVLSEDNYLMVRNAHVYPNGRQNSWCKERIYYFKKVNEA